MAHLAVSSCEELLIILKNLIVIHQYNKMVRSILIIVLVWFMHPDVSIAQKAIKKQGDIYFESGKYRDALAAYKAYNKTEKDPKLLIKRGLCYLYSNQPDACITDMAAAHKLKSLDHTRILSIQVWHILQRKSIPRQILQNLSEYIKTRLGRVA